MDRATVDKVITDSFIPHSGKMTRMKGKKKNKQKKQKRESMHGLTTLIPERHVVQLRLKGMFAYGSGGITSNYTNYFVVDGSSIYLPFTTGVNWSGSQNGSPSGIGGTTITTTFPGNSYLTGLYKEYRVLGGSLAITAMPEIGGDAVVTAIYAYPAVASGSAPPISYPAASQQLGARERLCAVGVAQKFNRVSSSVRSWDVVGMSRQEWMGLTPTAVGSDTTGAAAWSWAVQMCTADGTASGSTGIPVMMELSVDVEFMGPQIPLV